MCIACVTGRGEVGGGALPAQAAELGGAEAVWRWCGCASRTQSALACTSTLWRPYMYIYMQLGCGLQIPRRRGEAEQGLHDFNMCGYCFIQIALQMSAQHIPDHPPALVQQPLFNGAAGVLYCFMVKITASRNYRGLWLSFTVCGHGHLAAVAVAAACRGGFHLPPVHQGEIYQHPYNNHQTFSMASV